jgi:DNA-binding XRE family transcriptional regulator
MNCAELKHQRKALGLSQKQAAKVLRLSCSGYVAIERGVVRFTESNQELWKLKTKAALDNINYAKSSGDSFESDFDFGLVIEAVRNFV